ncbi:T9SS type A sorting domain-containing protein [bacterium]|nr:T9SS type A sorting domain-containing protein [bacterium]
MFRMRVAAYGLIVFALLQTAQLHAQITETGSFRSFILGDEPAAAYDNWISHTVEGLAVPGGYNHHMPPQFDRQTTGFGSFELISDDDAPAESLFWREIFTHMWNDDLAAAQALFNAQNRPFDAVYFNDTETGHTFRMVREQLNETYVDTGFFAGPDDDVTGSFDKGWGLFVFNPEAAIPWAHAQVVHVNDDFIAPPLTTDLFLDGDLGVFSMNGTGREVRWVDGEDYNNSRSLSDPSRNGNLPVQWFTQFVIDTLRAQGMTDLTIQFHSYDSESHLTEPTIQISVGPLDSYPNRGARDISGQGYDWVNFAPTVVVPADYSMPGQAEVAVQNYFAVWRGFGLTHLESGVEIPRNVQLSGYGDSPQMASAWAGVNRYETFDRWLHVEFDELPNPVAAAEYTELDFFMGTAPPTEENWDALLRYYEASNDALVAYLHDVENTQDTTPPSAADGLSVYYAADDFVELTWSQASLDPNFATYEVYYGTTDEIDTTNTLWNYTNDPDLVGQNVRFTSVNNLEFNQDYGFRVRGLDMSGQAGPLTETVRAITVEGDQAPLPFSLVSPLDADTCFTLDTTLTWQSTADPDLYDVPHYDVWMDTLPDLSTAWQLEDADSLADTTFSVEDLDNRRTLFWSVRATDRNTEGTWANEINSLVTWMPLPPAEFELKYPRDRETLFDVTTTQFRWRSTVSQNDPNWEIGYSLIVGNNSLFTVADTFDTQDTTWTYDVLEMDRTYYWKVLAYDQSDTTRSESVYRFYVWSHPIPNFSLVLPALGARVGSGEVTVTWEEPAATRADVTRTRVRQPQRESRSSAIETQLTHLSQQRKHSGKGNPFDGGQGWAAIDAQGGPDDFGHLWIDNDDPGGPAFDWIEISESGTMSTVSDMDDGTESVELPFTFPYYGGEFDTLVISSNGNAHFGTPDDGWQHYTIPSADGPAGILAPWWLDLRPNVRGTIFYQSFDDYFVVQWDNCQEYSHPLWSYTFQLILYSNGRIKFQYENMFGGLTDATIGIENLAEDDGLLIAFDAPYISNHIAILFTFEDWLYDVEWAADPAFMNPLSTWTFDTEYTIDEVNLLRLFNAGELDELPDDLTVFWRVNTMNLYSQTAWADPGVMGRNFMVYIQEPPDTFELLQPVNDAVVEQDTVTVWWHSTTDPDPLDTLSYVVEWSAVEDEFLPENSAVISDTFFTITELQQLVQTPPDGGGEGDAQADVIELPRGKRDKGRGKAGASVAAVNPAEQSGDPVEPGGNEIDELPDDSYLYWRVRARDQAGNETWPAHGETPWRFYVQVPEPPGPFALLMPVDGDTLTELDVNALTFSWEESVDPDPDEEVVYGLRLQVQVGTSIDTTLLYAGLTEPAITLNLADTLGIGEWEQWWTVDWLAGAVSAGDTTLCDEPFRFLVAPYLSVYESEFDGIPDEFSIARIYPNPFNPVTNVVVGIPHVSDVRIAVYNVLGRRVESIRLDNATPGYLTISLDGHTLASGIYFVQVTVPGQLNAVRKVVLVR